MSNDKKAYWPLNPALVTKFAVFGVPFVIAIIAFGVVAEGQWRVSMIMLVLMPIIVVANAYIAHIELKGDVISGFSATPFIPKITPRLHKRRFRRVNIHIATAIVEETEKGNSRYLIIKSGDGSGSIALSDESFSISAYDEIRKYIYDQRSKQL